tara:strand:- start:805 stop:960 length:156 start_codon:yes stop_codon:yes gene_type:complete
LKPSILPLFNAQKIIHRFDSKSANQAILQFYGTLLIDQFDDPGLIDLLCSG